MKQRDGEGRVGIISDPGYSGNLHGVEAIEGLESGLGYVVTCPDDDPTVPLPLELHPSLRPDPSRREDILMEVIGGARRRPGHNIERNRNMH